MLAVANYDQQFVKLMTEKESLEKQEQEINIELEALQKHSDVIKEQNLLLYDELDAISKTDDYVREQLLRSDIVSNIKARNYDALARSTHNLDRSRSPERQRARLQMI